MNPLSGWWRARRLKSRFWVIKRMLRALKWFLPMSRDVIRGDFRPVPWHAFGYMLLALGYLILPFDLIPEFLVLIGILDDVVIVGWLLNRIDRHMQAYREWKHVPDNKQDVTSTTT